MNKYVLKMNCKGHIVDLKSEVYVALFDITYIMIIPHNYSTLTKGWGGGGIHICAFTDCLKQVH